MNGDVDNCDVSVLFEEHVFLTAIRSARGSYGWLRHLTFHNLLY